MYAECALYIVIGGGAGAIVGQGLHLPPPVQVAAESDAVVTAEPTPTLLIIPASIPVAPPGPYPVPTRVPTPTPRVLPLPDPAPDRSPAVSPFVPNRTGSSGS